MAAKQGFLMYYSKGDAIGTRVSVRYRRSGRLSEVVVKRGSTVYTTRLASAKHSLSEYSPSLGQSLFWTTAPNSASSFYTSLPNSAVRGPQIPYISIILRTGSSVE